jgi:hypothetical protein
MNKETLLDWKTHVQQTNEEALRFSLGPVATSIGFNSLIKHTKKSDFKDSNTNEDIADA